MIVLENICKVMGARTLFDNVNVSFNPNERYGLTGPNGAGKSTLLKMIMGIEEITSGRVTLPKRVGFLKQDIASFAEYNLVDVVIMGNNALWKALEERDALYEQEITDEVGMRLGELEEIIAEEDGYSAESKAEVFLEGMGIDQESYRMKMKEIANDLQFRVLICQALFGNPQALLLDEPTNHLDLESIRWLENFLKEYTGVLVVISHDRHFLNTITTSIADIDYETIIMYPGNYDQMVYTKSSNREREIQQARSKEKKISQLQEFVQKFAAGTRASQVKSRVKEIDRLKPQQLKESNIQRPYIYFPPPEKKSGQVLYKVNKLTKSFDELDVIKRISFEIHRGDKIGIIGNNGRGKTTLIKLLSGALKPSSGAIELGFSIESGYFPQSHSEYIDKNSKLQVFDWLRHRAPRADDQAVRSSLGKMLFSGDDAFKNVATLSGGESARLILSYLMLIPHNTLFLDEPNNHLDLEAVSALGVSLKEYQGTVIVASHDRDLMDHVATKIIAFEKDGIVVFNGSLEAYLSSKA